MNTLKGESFLDSNHISNEQIKTKTAYLFNRPLANCIVEVIDNQNILEKNDVDLLKQSSCYWKPDKIATTKTAQKKLQKRVDPETWHLSYAISCKKTITKRSTTHWCRKHQTFARGKHIDECNLLQSSLFPERKVTHYNYFWLKEDHLKATQAEFEEMNSFYTELRTKIATAEEQGQFIPASRSITFPSSNGKLQEPEGTAWIQAPLYAKKAMKLYQKIMIGCRPVSIANRDPESLDALAYNIINPMPFQEVLAPKER